MFASQNIERFLGTHYAVHETFLSDWSAGISLRFILPFRSSFQVFYLVIQRVYRLLHFCCSCHSVAIPLLFRQVLLDDNHLENRAIKILLFSGLKYDPLSPNSSLTEVMRWRTSSADCLSNLLFASAFSASANLLYNLFFISFGKAIKYLFFQMDFSWYLVPFPA